MASRPPKTLKANKCRPLEASKPEEATKASKTSQATKADKPSKAGKPGDASVKASRDKPPKAAKTSRSGKEGIGSAFIRKVKKATCLGEPDVVSSETDLDPMNKGQGDAPDDTLQKQDAQDLIPNDLNHDLAKKFKALDKKLAKRAAKKAAKEAAEKKEQERREEKMREKEMKMEKQRARREAKEETKRAKRQRKMDRKAAREVQKRATKTNSASVQDKEKTESSALPVPFPEILQPDAHYPKKRFSTTRKKGSKKATDTSPVSVPSVNSPSCQDIVRSPPSGRCLPPGSPEHQLICQDLGHTSSQDSRSSSNGENAAVPDVEVPLSSADDAVAGGMSYRLPQQRQSSITVQRRQSRSPSPARLVSPPSSSTAAATAARVSPQASRTPHPPGGGSFSRTEYIPSTGRPTSRRFSKTGALDNTPVEKFRFSRYGGPDINANSSRYDLHVKHTTTNKLQQQSRQQPLRAIHPQPESVTKNPRLSRLHGNRNFHSEGDDLADDIVSLQLDDNSAGSMSPGSSRGPSRRSSFTSGQKAKGSSSDLRCPPIPGASPPNTASKHKMTRHGSVFDAEYKPNFANTLINQSSTSNNKVLSRTKVTTQLDDFSKSEGDKGKDKDKEKEKEKEETTKSQGDKAFTSAQHSVLGTGRTGNTTPEDLGGKIGLNNLGNSCYMNAILQCLCQNKSLRDYFLTDKYLANLNHRSPQNGRLARSFARLMKEIWTPCRVNPVSPNYLMTAFQRIALHFGTGKQQDAQEFMCYFISELHEETNTAAGVHGNEPDIPDDISEDEKAQMAWDRYCARHDSIFSRLFVGQLKSTLECQTCKYRSVTFDIFWDLSVPVPERPRPSVQRHSSQEKEPVPFNIKDCLNKFTEAEVLNGENMVTCNKCKRKRVFTKTFSIQRFPKYLVLHLKRFSALRSKLTTHIEFPLEGLDMSKYHSGKAATTMHLTNTISHIASDWFDMYQAMWNSTNAPPLEDYSEEPPDEPDTGKDTYKLHGVSRHSGSMLGGHYIAYAKHILNNQWYCFDDTRVEAITENLVPNSYAYVLFYHLPDNDQER